MIAGSAQAWIAPGALRPSDIPTRIERIFRKPVWAGPVKKI